MTDLFKAPYNYKMDSMTRYPVIQTQMLGLTLQAYIIRFIFL